MKVLVVIDMQKDFISGPLGTPEAQVAALRVASKVREYANKEDSIILYTRDTHYNNYLDTQEGEKLPVPHCLYGTEGWEIVPEVYVDNGATEVVDKNTFGFYDIHGAVYRAILKRSENFQIDHIEICGVCTDICVVSNAILLKTNYPEVPITVNSACCAGVTPEKHEAALEVMRSCQIDVI